MVKLETDMGDIIIELDEEKAPGTVANFLNYVKAGHYDGTIFHRVIDGFMIQGGGMDADMKERSTGDPIENEADNGLTNDAYTVAWCEPWIRTVLRPSFSSMSKRMTS